MTNCYGENRDVFLKINQVPSASKWNSYVCNMKASILLHFLAKTALFIDMMTIFKIGGFPISVLFRAIYFERFYTEIITINPISSHVRGYLVSSISIFGILALHRAIVLRVKLESRH